MWGSTNHRINVVKKKKEAPRQCISADFSCSSSLSAAAQQLLAWPPPDRGDKSPRDGLKGVGSRDQATLQNPRDTVGFTDYFGPPPRHHKVHAFIGTQAVAPFAPGNAPLCAVQPLLGAAWCQLAGGFLVAPVPVPPASAALCLQGSLCASVLPRALTSSVPVTSLSSACPSPVHGHTPPPLPPGMLQGQAPGQVTGPLTLPCSPGARSPFLVGSWHLDRPGWPCPRSPALVRFPGGPHPHPLTLHHVSLDSASIRHLSAPVSGSHWSVSCTHSNQTPARSCGALPVRQPLLQLHF